MRVDVHGILLLDKPLGLSSAAAVARVKWLFSARKAGHTGSLDPLATGLLPVCLGEATKFGAHLLDADKSYRVTVRLGERTPSADRESEVIERRALPGYSPDDLREALRLFPREYEQIPPMHSAIKQGGRPLYEYARAGISRERAARSLTIRALELIDWAPPDLCFDVGCSKGTYVRVLAEDLAARMGTIGHLAALRRLSVDPFGAVRQWTFEALEALDAPARSAALLPVDAALTGWRRYDLSPSALRALRQGQTVAIAAGGEQAPGTVRIYADGMGFLGLGEIEAGGRLVPRRLISADAHPPNPA
ncbi:MAG TPA: tRNA pseudouridine(55) synthase TruB [Steroidobacteraceae bacterium]|jgi:tRNA pseudouridine55 synthase|nr:tRNA pseudouridine(55) synthase TruB [Steroidobacteraceae bacterium]